MSQVLTRQYLAYQTTLLYICTYMLVFMMFFNLKAFTSSGDSKCKMHVNVLDKTADLSKFKKNMYLVPLICKVVRLILFVFPLYCGRRLVSERLFATLYYTFNTQTHGFYCKRVHPLCHHVTTPHHVISSYHR